MIILSIDVGIKNLAHCLFEIDDNDYSKYIIKDYSKYIIKEYIPLNNEYFSNKKETLLECNGV